MSRILQANSLTSSPMVPNVVSSGHPYEFRPRPERLSSVQQFAFLATGTELDSDASTLKFAQWASWNCIGEDLDLPMVSLGYHLDHLLEDCCDPRAALHLVREQLPNCLPECRDIVQALTQEIPVNDQAK